MCLAGTFVMKIAIEQRVMVTVIIFFFSYNQVYVMNENTTHHSSGRYVKTRRESHDYVHVMLMLIFSV